MALRAGVLLNLASDFAREGIGLCGVGLVSYGVWQWFHPAGYIVAGLMLITAAWLLGGVRKRE